MRRRMAMVATLVLAAAPAVAAPPVWGGLAPGPHAIGFRVLFGSDSARAYFPATDPTEGTLARPIQITLWYPARPGTGSAMRFGDYVEVAEAELGPGRDIVPSVGAEFRRGPMRPFFGGPPSDEAWSRVLAVEFASRREALPAPGRFPLVLHAGGGGALAQGVLLEFLASRGYVVASVPLLGPGAAWHNRGEWSVRSIEEMAADLAHATRVAAELPFVDAQRIAVIGSAAGGQGVLQAMRSRAVGAIVALESSWFESLESSPHFDVRAFRAPILDLPSEEIRRTEEGRERLRYADRTVIRIAGSTHLDTYQFRRVALAAGEPDGDGAIREAVAKQHAQYELSAELAREFLDCNLRGEAAACDALVRREEDARVVVSRALALPTVPTEEELLAMVRNGEAEAARRLVAEAREREPALVLFDEQPMTTTARFLARDRGFAAAADAFRLILDTYPESAPAHESLGDALARIDRGEEAAASWRRALELTSPKEAERRKRLETKLAGPP